MPCRAVLLQLCCAQRLAASITPLLPPLPCRDQGGSRAAREDALLTPEPPRMQLSNLNCILFIFFFFPPERGMQLAGVFFHFPTKRFVLFWGLALLSGYHVIKVSSPVSCSSPVFPSAVHPRSWLQIRAAISPELPTTYSLPAALPSLPPGLSLPHHSGGGRTRKIGWAFPGTSGGIHSFSPCT